MVVGAVVLAILVYCCFREQFSLTKLALIFFLIFNFLGVFAYAAGYRALTFLDFNQDFDAETTQRALLIASVGALAFLIGTRARAIAKPAEAAANPGWILLLGIIYGLAALVLPGTSLFDIVAHFGKINAVALLNERLKISPSTLTVAVDYVLTSIPALYALALYLDRKCPLWIALVFVLVAALAKFATLQKEPFMVFLIQCGVLFYARRRFRARTVLVAVGGAFVCLVGLFALYQGGSAKLLAAFAGERIFLRTAASYCYVAQWVPHPIDFSGMDSIPTWAAMWGHTYTPLSVILFRKASTVLVLGGTMSVPNIPWLFAAFGWTGVVVGSMLSGAFTGLLDRFVVPSAGPARWAAIAILSPIGFYLTETTLFGALAGFGGALATLHVILLNRRGAAGQCATEPYPSGKLAARSA